MAVLKTFIFTDIVRSVALKKEMSGRDDTERDRAFIECVLTPHRERIDVDLATRGGRIVSTAGDGHFLVFSDTIEAALWAVAMQRSHLDRPIQVPSGNAVEVRVSMHVGFPQIDPRDEDNFVGKTVDYAARLNDFAGGGQILVSRSVASMLDDAQIEGLSIHGHGRRGLRGIGRVEIHELVYREAGPMETIYRPAKADQRLADKRQWTILPASMKGTPQPSGPPDAATVAAQTTAAQPAQPRRLGHYELGEMLGSGGMGDVYRARHTQFGRERAIKVIKQQFVDAGHEDVVRRFYQEIKAIGALEHPNIVVAIDSSAPTDRVHYLVMEYIDGSGLDTLVSQHGPLSVADACEVARQAARGLAYIDRHGMVHRDIKPSNLMLKVSEQPMPVDEPSTAGTPFQGKLSGVVKILDLGLTLLTDDDQNRLTQYRHQAMGTAMYMSPEQWKTSSVDIRADIYSLGCTLYHLLAGRPPFLNSDLRPEKAHERETFPPIGGPEPIPKALWSVLQKMTAKRPEDRYADPDAVVASLAPFTTGHDLPDLASQWSKASPDAITRMAGHSETQASRSAGSDALRRRLLSPGSSKLSSKERWTALGRRFWLWGIPLILVAAIPMIYLLSTQLNRVRQSSRESRQHTLTVAAKYAASEIAKGLDSRFKILERYAKESELRALLTTIDASPDERERWKPLQRLLGSNRSDSDEEAPSESWFVNDARGIQVARSPRSIKSIGKSYAHRDYFHGQGRDLEEGTTGVAPIEARNQSAVYRSSSTGRLKVALSIPIWNKDDDGSADRRVLGVLAMSTDLGEFKVLENVLKKEREQQVVLIDLRPDCVGDGEEGRGLILYHRQSDHFSKDAPPPRLSGDLLDQIEKTLLISTPSVDLVPNLLLDYSDPVLGGKKKYWGAFERVFSENADGEPQDTGWLVLVQEPADP